MFLSHVLATVMLAPWLMSISVTLKLLESAAAKSGVCSELSLRSKLTDLHRYKTM